MDTAKGPIEVSDIVCVNDTATTEMTTLRSRVSELEHAPVARDRSVRETEFFGMWADRDDMRGKTSRQWVEEQRQSQWTRR